MKIQRATLLEPHCPRFQISHGCSLLSAKAAASPQKSGLGSLRNPACPFFLMRHTMYVYDRPVNLPAQWFQKHRTGLFCSFCQPSISYSSPTNQPVKYPLKSQLSLLDQILPYSISWPDQWPPRVEQSIRRRAGANFGRGSSTNQSLLRLLSGQRLCSYEKLFAFNF